MSSFSTLKDELKCPICLCVYTEPVTLRCGHNFCNLCIHQALDSQVSSPRSQHRHFCPYCRKRFTLRPDPQPNITLCNIVKRLQSSPGPSNDGIFCTYCITAPVSAVMSCLLCEASLCNDHIAVHNNSPEHVLVAPATFARNRECIVHSKFLDYFNPEDATCGYRTTHGNHQTQRHAGPSESLKLNEVLEKPTLKRKMIANHVEDLLLHRRKVQSTADGYALKTKVLFANLKRDLSTLEIRVLKEIWRQDERVSVSIDDNIKQLEVRKNKVSKQITLVKTIGNFPIPEPEIDGQGQIENEGTNREYPILQEKFHAGHFNPVLISETLRRELRNIMTNTEPIYAESRAIDLLLDAGTAGRRITVSKDQKTASWTSMKKRSNNPARLGVYQVLSTRSFSGKYYWEVETCGNRIWRIGVAYPSIGKKKPTSRIGDDEKSWCLCRYQNEYSVRHDQRKIVLSTKVSALRLGVYLDSQAGTLSFYELGDPIEQLYTFTTTFSGPVHAVLYLGGRGWLRIG